MAATATIAAVPLSSAFRVPVRCRNVMRPHAMRGLATYRGEHGLSPPSSWQTGMRDMGCSAALRSVHPRRFEEFGAVGRIHAHVEGDAFTIERERHFDARIPQRPDLAVERGQRR